jgi:hypothetical protein
MQSMGKTVKRQRLEARVAEQHFQPVTGGRVALKYDPEVSDEGMYHSEEDGWGSYWNTEYGTLRAIGDRLWPVSHKSLKTSAAQLRAILKALG